MNSFYYKNEGKNQKEMRRRRAEVSVQLRKVRRGDDVERRRHALMDMDDLPINSSSLATEKKTAIKDSKQEEKLEAIRQILSRENPPIDDFIESDVLPFLVNCIRYIDQPNLQYEAVVSLSNIIKKATSLQINEIVLAGIVPSLVQLLSSPEENICNEALLALGGIIEDGPVLREYVIENGLVKPLLAFVRPDVSTILLRNTTRLIFKLLKPMEYPPPLNTVQEVIPALYWILHHSDLLILYDSLMTIRCLTDENEDQIEMVIDGGLITKITPLLGHANEKIQGIALRTLANIVTGSDEQAQVVLNNGALAYFPDLLSHPMRSEDAMWFLSNITAGNDLQIKTVIEAGLLPQIIARLKSSQLSTRKLAVCIMSNLAASLNEDRIRDLIKLKAIPYLCDLLQCKDCEIAIGALITLDTILEHEGKCFEKVIDIIYECNGVDNIEDMQYHINRDICVMASGIIDRFFSEENNDAIELNFQNQSNFENFSF